MMKSWNQSSENTEADTIETNSILKVDERFETEENTEADNMEIKANQLVDELQNLDFKDYESVLNWFWDFENTEANLWVKNEEIISIFKMNWYKIGLNKWIDYNWEDAENYAKYLAWQALDWIHLYGTPDQVIHHFINDWKKKFGKRKQTDDIRIKEIMKSLL